MEEIAILNRYPIKRLLIEEGVTENPLCERVCRILSPLTPEYIPGDEISSLNCDTTTLVLSHNKGKFLKPCPGTKEYLCCLYNFLNVGLNCPINCTYCILQAYLNLNALIVYVNYPSLLAELAEVLKADLSLVRIGTGELTDSLALDPLITLNPLLIEFFSRQDQAFLELKTKSDTIEHLLNLDHQGKTIISWSLNPQSIIDSEEGLAAPLESRITAAQRCQSKGYKVGFHFDPIILYKGWENEYESLIELLQSRIDHRSVTWISMGCFRFLPALKYTIQAKFPKSKIIYQEFIPGLDKKMRYPQPIRVQIYSKMAGWIRKKIPEAFIYLCMESPEVWKSALGYAPEDNNELKLWLDRRCRI